MNERPRSALATEQTVRAAALTLDAAAREQVAEALWASLCDSSDGGTSPLSPAWAADVQRRLAELNAGTLEGVPADEVFRHLRQRSPALTSVHPDAEPELRGSVDDLNAQRRGLGDGLAAEVATAVGRAEARPTLHPPVAPDVYRVLTRWFPFGVVDAVRPAGVIVPAVMHLHREPGYWTHPV